MTTTIRVSTHTRDLLHQLAQRSGVSMQSVLEQALEQYRRHQLLEATNAAYAALHIDAEAWADLEHERSEWDQTLADGLEEA
jgi:predicted transcriptional regulator